MDTINKSQFNSNRQRFHAHGYVCNTIADNQMIPSSFKGDDEVDVVPEVECYVRCDFSNLDPVMFDRIRSEKNALLASRAYDAYYGRFLKFVIDPYLLCSTDAFARIAGTQSRLSYQQRSRARSQRFADADVTLLSHLHSDGLSMCVEYSAMAHRWLSMTGIDSAFIGGSVLRGSNKKGNLHAYLVIQGRQNDVLFLEAGQYNPSVEGDVFAPVIYRAPIEDFKRFIDRGRTGKSWIKAESVWTRSSAFKTASPDISYFGFDGLPNRDNMLANLVNPDKASVGTKPQIRV